MWSCLLTILLLSLCWIELETQTTSVAPTSDPTTEPTIFPTMEPTYHPTLPPTADSQSPTRSPSKFPTETPATNSFLNVTCLDNNHNENIKYSIMLTEENGFNDNIYGRLSVINSETVSDLWNLSNIEIPIIEESNTCYLHIYLSNHDFWGYRSNATCSLSFTIEKTNKINDSSLNLYNILDINQKYNTFWNLQATSNKTDFFFQSYPSCQPLTALLHQNINFATINVKDFIYNSHLNHIFESNTGEILTSSTGLWPYYFYLASKQQENTSHFKILPGFLSSLGQTCVYDEALPIYNDNKNMSKIKKGGIDYYLFINSSSSSSAIAGNLIVNIQIQQSCDVLQEIETTTKQPDDEGNDNKFPFNLGVMILFAFAACFVCMAVAMFFIWCFQDNTQEYEEKNNIEMEIYANDEIMDTADDINIDPEDAEILRFVVSEEDHQEMLDILRRGSMSTGLE